MFLQKNRREFKGNRFLKHMAEKKSNFGGIPIDYITGS